MIENEIKKEKYEREKDIAEERNERPKFKKDITKEEWEKKHDKYIPEING